MFFQSEVNLPDGTSSLIRPLAPTDAPLIAAGFAQLSAESRELRFFTPLPDLSIQMLRSLVEVDQHDHMALIAVPSDHPERGLGVARSIRSTTDPTRAEIAVTVIDAAHRRGIGTALLRALRRAARAGGIRTFEGYVLLQNRPALEWLRSTGAHLEHDGGGLIRFEIPLQVQAATSTRP